jgi:mono/diheme cytochrome c family protein
MNRFCLALLALYAGCLSAAEPGWKDVHAILEAHCTECHGPAKQKGHVRLDSPDWLTKGNKDGPVVVAGKPEASRIYTLAALPDDNDDKMPPNGDRVSAAQLAVLKTWIAAGAKVDTPPPAPAAAATASPPATEIPIESAPTVPESVQTQLSAAQIAITRYPGGWLSVNAAHTRTGITDEQLTQLTKIAPAVAQIDLAGSGITDRQVGQLKGFANLERLHLERTSITDEALKSLSGLKRLRYLNLVGTQVGDAGLGALAGLADLQELYVWQSKVTAGGAAELRKKLPDLQLVLGPDDMPKDKLAPGKGKKKK